MLRERAAARKGFLGPGGRRGPGARRALPRRQLLELGDLPWAAGWLREAYQACLSGSLRLGGHYRDAWRPFLEWVRRAGRDPADGRCEVLDMGSGGGGPVETMLLAARRANQPFPRVVLSDLRPSPAHFRRLQARHGERAIGFVARPVDATRAGPTPQRLRLFCSTFHHFRPAEARAALADAAAHSDGVFILEPLRRDLLHALMVLLWGPLPYMAGALACRPLRPAALLFGVLVPLAPLMLVFDGCVSALRCYTPDDVRAMFPDDRRNEFEFGDGLLPYLGPCAAGYVYAVRRRADAAPRSVA